MNSFMRWLAGALLAVATTANSAEPSHVLVDPSEQHTTTFVGVPKAVPQKEFEALQQTVSQRAGAYMVTWEEFKQSPGKHVRAFIRRNDYPNVDVAAGLTQLLDVESRMIA